MIIYSELFRLKMSTKIEKEKVEAPFIWNCCGFLTCVLISSFAVAIFLIGLLWGWSFAVVAFRDYNDDNEHSAENIFLNVLFFIYSAITIILSVIGTLSIPTMFFLYLMYMWEYCWEYYIVPGIENFERSDEDGDHAVCWNSLISFRAWNEGSYV